jgi:phytoene synthase
MMTHVFGFRDESCFPQAIALGTAMQLTNIARDVGEDLDRGRIYLPLDELARFGVTPESLEARRADAPFRSLMRFQVERARGYYREATGGVPLLATLSGRLTVRVMGRLYGGILEEIEAIDYNVLERRAFVPTSRKLALLARCQAETLAESARRFWQSPARLPRSNSPESRTRP